MLGKIVSTARLEARSELVALRLDVLSEEERAILLAWAEHGEEGMSPWAAASATW